jgi:hypothetical protein
MLHVHAPAAAAQQLCREITGHMEYTAAYAAGKVYERCYKLKCIASAILNIIDSPAVTG